MQEETLEPSINAEIEAVATGRIMLRALDVDNGEPGAEPAWG